MSTPTSKPTRQQRSDDSTPSDTTSKVNVNIGFNVANSKNTFKRLNHDESDLSPVKKKSKKRQTKTVEDNANMYKWSVVNDGDGSCDGSKEGGLKMTFKKIPKTPAMKTNLRSLDKIRQWINNEHESSKKNNDNVGKKVILGRPQPFRIKASSGVGGSTKVSSKTGEPLSAV